MTLTYITYKSLYLKLKHPSLKKLLVYLFIFFLIDRYNLIITGDEVFSVKKIELSIVKKKQLSAYKIHFCCCDILTTRQNSRNNV